MKILFTSAVIEYNYEVRKNQYIESFKKLCECVDKSDIYIVETILSGGSFMEELTDNVYYTNVNNSNLKNKGVNELLSLKKFFDMVDFDEDEKLLKITGRYLLLSDHFINFCDGTNYNNIGKKTKDQIQIFTGCFQTRYGIFNRFINTVNYNVIEKSMINIEKVFYDFLKKIDNVHFVDKIDIQCQINKNNYLTYF